MEKKTRPILLKNMVILFAYVILVGLTVMLFSQAPDDKAYSAIYSLGLSGIAMAIHFLVNAVLATAAWIRKDEETVKAHILSLFLIPVIGIPTALGVSLISDVFLLRMSIPDLLK